MGTGIYSGHNSYGSNLARKKQRRFFAKLISLLVMVLILSGASVYMLFFSPYLKITDKNINGLKTVEASEIYSILDSAVNKNIFSILGLNFANNIVFLNSESIRNKILAQFPVIKETEVIKEYPHKITINITERMPSGIWCFGEECNYFDEDGIIWGKALKSSGPLFVNVDDLRSIEGNISRVDGEFLTGIKKSLDGLDKLGIKIKRFEIPQDSIGDFRAYTVQGYFLIFNTESDIDSQINVFKIFLDEREDSLKLTSQASGLEYIDLRVEGRVYYK